MYRPEGSPCRVFVMDCSLQDTDTLASMQDAILARCADWVIANLAAFSPPTRREDEACGDPGLGPKRKALGELCVAFDVLQLYAARRLPDARDAILDWITAQTKAPYFFEHMYRKPESFAFYNSVHASLRKAGRRQAEIEHWLKLQCAGGLLEYIERTPWQTIATKFGLEQSGLPDALPPYPELVARSIVARFPYLSQAREMDIYALTHVIMFTTNFGARPFDDRYRAAMAETVLHLILMSIIRGDADIVGELLICALCLNVSEDWRVAEGWRFLYGALHATGAILDHRYVAGERLDDSPFEPFFASNYHPTLVALMAACLAVARRA